MSHTLIRGPLQAPKTKVEPTSTQHPVVGPAEIPIAAFKGISNTAKGAPDFTGP